MGTTKCNGRKSELDKFYTIPQLAKALIDSLEISKYDKIIEPSAGNGSFSNLIPNCIAYDIAPDSNNIIEQDFLKLQIQYQENTLIIGNPPFGVGCNLAIQFFNKSATLSDTIAFILPLTFRKPSIQNKLDLRFHLVKEIEIPKDSFTLNGEIISVPCVFQIWEKRTPNRQKKKSVTTTKYFKFVDRENANVRIQRVGGKAGFATTNLSGAISSNYFIKVDNPEEFCNTINSLSFPTVNYTVGAKSLSKTELIETYEDHILKLSIK